MNPFKFVAKWIKDACWEGFRQFTAELDPESPPPTLEALQARINPPPALPAAEPQPADAAEETTPTKPRGKRS